MVKLLSLHAVSRTFSGLQAVDRVDMAIDPARVHALIGPNGAGKTTLFNLISGVTAVSAGVIRFNGADITGLSADRRAALGIARTFQNIRIFGTMTVLENVLTGLHPRLSAGLFSIICRRQALDLVGLADRAAAPAASLAYGDQRRLEIARALVPAPRLLLLDEPAAGMNPAETAGLKRLLETIRRAGTTVLLVEHDMSFVMEVSDHITVLNFGRRIFDGAPAEARSSTAVIEAYLGHKVAARLSRR
jgi:ABC-type branched-subunit amino acid transport system ATPase component